MQHSIWYTAKALGKTSFNHFMPDISKYAKCSRRYTAHCLRATAIQKMSDEGFQCPQIMMMSGHRNEASIRSYSRNCTSTQKRSISRTLSTLTGTISGENRDRASVSNVNNDANRNGTENRHILPSSSTVSKMPVSNVNNEPATINVNTADQLSVALPPRVHQSETTQALTPINNALNVPSYPLNMMSASSFQTMAGLLSNSSFHNCSFHFESAKEN